MKQTEVNRFNELYPRHLRMLKLQGKSQKTIDSYSRAVRRVRDYFGCCPDQLTPDALQDYHWPGNIRELENVLERAVINSSGPKLRLVDELKKPLKGMRNSQKTLETVERDYIVQTLEQTGWKVGGKNSTAEILGLDRSTLRAHMRKLNIQKD